MSFSCVKGRMWSFLFQRVHSLALSLTVITFFEKNYSVISPNKNRVEFIQCIAFNLSSILIFKSPPPAFLCTLHWKISERRLQKILSFRWETRINPGCGGSVYKAPETLWASQPVHHPSFLPPNTLCCLCEEELSWQRCTNFTVIDCPIKPHYIIYCWGLWISALNVWNTSAHILTPSGQ